MKVGSSFFKTGYLNNARVPSETKIPKYKSSFFSFLSFILSSILAIAYMAMVKANVSKANTGWPYTAAKINPQSTSTAEAAGTVLFASPGEEELPLLFPLPRLQP